MHANGNIFKRKRTSGGNITSYLFQIIKTENENKKGSKEKEPIKQEQGKWVIL